METSRTKSPRHVVGVISDTHGLIRPEAVDRLRGSDLIVHCGDIGASAVLDALRAVAPARAVRDNNDNGPWASELPTNHTPNYSRDMDARVPLCARTAAPVATPAGAPRSCRMAVERLLPPGGWRWDAH